MRTMAEYREHARRRDALIRANTEIGLTIVIDILIEKLKQTTLFRDVTGNLRASIGVNSLIQATKTLEGQRKLQKGRGKLGSGAVNIMRLIKKVGSKLIGIIPVGMSYAPDVEKRRGFMAAIMGSGLPKKLMDEQMAAAARATTRELGMGR